MAAALPDNDEDFKQESLEIHKTLRKSVKLFTYWARRIKRYEDYKKELYLEQNEGDRIRIKKTITRFEELTSCLKNKDKTDFAAAEVGFLLEVQAEGDEPHIKYYHYPVKLPSKNILNIYDLDENDDMEEVKEFIDSANEREVDPERDYHSETVLFLLFQKRWFQEDIINKLIEDLKKKGNPNLKVKKLKNLTLEIHSVYDICDDCFERAEYLINWEEEELEELKYFRQKLTDRLKEVSILDQNLDLDLKILVIFSSEYNKTSKKSNPSFIWRKIRKGVLTDSKTELSKYSILTSGGSSVYHQDYPRAFDKATAGNEE